MSALNNSMWNSKSGEEDFYTYQIANSVRFDGSSSRLVKTWGADASNNDKVAVSVWVKLTETFVHSEYQRVWSSAQNDLSGMYFLSGSNVNSFGFDTANGGANPRTTAKFRDPGAWLHIVWIYDSSQSTATDRVKVYFNGEFRNLTDTAFWATNSVCNQNTDNGFGKNGNANHIGDYQYNSSGYFGGLMADFISIDGTAAISDFGETKNGVWIPKDPSGLTFGNNGFWLKFTNASDFGEDYSGNNNDWTVNNLAAHDQMRDSPTFGEDSDGNFCIMNTVGLTGGGTAIANHTDTTEGGLAVHVDAGGGMGTMGMHASTGGKWYWEYRATDYQDGGILGITNDTFNSDAEIAYNSPSSGLLGDTIGYYFDNGNVYAGVQDGGTSSSYGAKVTAGDILSVAVDVDAGKIWFAENGTFLNSGNPATGANAARGAGGTITTAMDFTTATWFPAVGCWSAADMNGVFNFGQDGTFAGAISNAGNTDANGNGNFKYAPPSGFLALCTGSLPDPAADPNTENPPSKFFSPYIWTGNGQNRNITIASDKKPSVTWIKNYLGDTVSWNIWTHAYVGFNGDPDSFLEPVGTALIYANQGNDGPFTGAPSATALPLTVYGQVNGNTHSYVGYVWSMNGGDNSTNDDGSVDSEVDANATVGQSLVAWTGTNNTWGNAITVGHGLGAVPHFIIGKQLTGNADEWQVYHHAVGPGNGSTAAHSSLVLNNTAALYSNQSYKGFGGVLPTSTVFTVDGNNLNRASATLFAMCFTSKDGYSRFGRFEGNGNVNGTFVNCGFRPATIWLKSIDSTSDWLVYDNKRLGYNPDNNSLSINTTAVQTTTDLVDILSNGFKFRINNTDPNLTETYIYCAWAEVPYKYATSRF